MNNEHIIISPKTETDRQADRYKQMKT